MGLWSGGAAGVEWGRGLTWVWAQDPEEASAGVGDKDLTPLAPRPCEGLCCGGIGTHRGWIASPPGFCDRRPNPEHGPHGWPHGPSQPSLPLAAQG